MANTLLPGEDLTFLLCVVIITALLIVSIVLYHSVILPFIEERKYLKMELRRSEYDGEEYRYYKKKLNRLYLSCIPFIGRFFK